MTDSCVSVLSRPSARYARKRLANATLTPRSPIRVVGHSTYETPLAEIDDSLVFGAWWDRGRYVALASLAAITVTDDRVGAGDADADAPVDAPGGTA